MPRLLKSLLTVLVVATALCLPASAMADHATLRGYKVFYKVRGHGSPALVFIHGWCGDHSFWQNQAPELAKRFKVVLVDLPGFGQSEAPRRDYSQAYLARGVAAVIKAAGIKRAVLVTHSMGLSVALAYARQHPKQLAGIFNLDGALLMPPDDPKALAAWQKQAADWAAPLKGSKADKAKLAFLRTMFTDETPPAARAHIEEVFLASPWYVADSTMEHFQDPALWRVPPLDIPVMSLYARTPYLTPQFEARLKELFPKGGYLVWQGPGHFIMYDRPQAVTAEIARFAASVK